MIEEGVVGPETMGGFRDPYLVVLIFFSEVRSQSSIDGVFLNYPGVDKAIFTKCKVGLTYMGTYVLGQSQLEDGQDHAKVMDLMIYFLDYTSCSLHSRSQKCNTFLKLTLLLK